MILHVANPLPSYKSNGKLPKNDYKLSHGKFHEIPMNIGDKTRRVNTVANACMSHVK